MKEFDIAIVGGGPGGYVAAIRGAKLGLSVALIEADQLGGTCLNRGCIPSKTLLKHAEVWNQINDSETFGITIKDASFSIEKMIDKKNNVIKQLQNGINMLLKQNKITLFNGVGTVQENKEITIKQNDGNEEKIIGKHIILATGSEPFVPSIDGIEEVDVYTSDTIFDIQSLPDHLTIIGGGVIGIEIACIFYSLGTKVEIVEMADRILPSEDKEASQFLSRQLEDADVTLHTNAKVVGFENKGNITHVLVEKNDGIETIETNAVLMSVGRKPVTTGLDDLSLSYDGPFVSVDNQLQTSVSQIYAIGDLIGGYQLAHAASEEGIRAVENIGGNKMIKQPLIPRCVYSFPEIATVGKTETEAKEAGYNVKVKKIDLAGNGKAIASGQNKGFMKIIVEKTFGEIIGVVLVGANVTEMISQATTIMELEGTIDELSNIVFPHPTISEGVFESAQAWLDKGIHYS